MKFSTLLVYVIIFGCSSTRHPSSNNKDLVNSYINARNNYDVEKVKALVDENYTETFIYGSKEVENKIQLTEFILWGKSMDSKIKLLDIESDDEYITTIEEYSNYLDIALERKRRKFKIVYTFRDNKILSQKLDTLPGYQQIMEHNHEKYEAFVKYCTQNNLNYIIHAANQESGMELRKVLEKYEADQE